MFGCRAQEGPPVVYVASDPRVRIRLERVLIHADLLYGRVDLDGVDMAGTVL